MPYKVVFHFLEDLQLIRGVREKYFREWEMKLELETGIYFFFPLRTLVTLPPWSTLDLLAPEIKSNLSYTRKGWGTKRWNKNKTIKKINQTAYELYTTRKKDPTYLYSKIKLKTFFRRNTERFITNSWNVFQEFGKLLLQRTVTLHLTNINLFYIISQQISKPTFIKKIQD